MYEGSFETIAVVESLCWQFHIIIVITPELKSKNNFRHKQIQTPK